MPLADDSGHRSAALGARRPQGPQLVALLAGRLRLAVRAGTGAEDAPPPAAQGRKRMTTLAPLDAYRLLAQDYDTAPNPLLTLEQRTLKLLFPPLRGAKVVDAAAGTGRWAAYCRSQGARTIAA